MPEKTLPTDQLIEEHFEVPDPEDLEGVAQPGFGGGDLVRPANNLTEPGLEPEDEITSERTLRTKTYLLDEDDNRYRTIGASPQAHYRDNPDDKEEPLKEIDLTIIDAGRRYRLNRTRGTSNAPYELSVQKGQIGYQLHPKSGGEVDLVLDRIGETNVDSRFIEEHAFRSVSGNVIVWDIPSLDISIRLVARPEKVEVYKTIRNPQSPRGFEWIVAERKGDHKWAFLNQEAKGWDAEGDNVRLESDKKFLSEDDDFEYFEYREEFLGQSAKVVDSETREREWKSAEYPVDIDPSTSKDITANIDDVTQFTDTGSFDSNQLKGGDYYAGARPGMRFRSLGIGSGATISSATLSLYIEYLQGSLSQNIYADDVDDAPQWSSNDTPADITKTSNSVAWAWTSESVYTSTKITSIVQEVVSRSGWSSNNAMRFAGFDNGNFNGGGKAYDYNSGSSKVATLSVTWTEPQPITINAPVESSTIQKNSPSVNAKSSISSPIESLTSTENSPTTTASATVSIPVQGLNATEIFPGVSAKATASPGPENLSASDVIPTVTAAGYTASAPVEALTSSGPVPGIIATATIPSPVESLTSSENSPSITNGVSVQVPLESLTSSELTPNINAGGSIIQPGIESLSSSQIEPSVSGAYLISVPIESLTSSQITPSVSFATAIIGPSSQILTADDLEFVVNAGSFTASVQNKQLTISDPIVTLNVEALIEASEKMDISQMSPVIELFRVRRDSAVSGNRIKDDTRGNNVTEFS